jgi:hypothetical protein
MCIDVEHFITDENKLNEYICPIGKGIVVDPVYLNCGNQTIHILCKQCLENYEKSQNQVSYYYSLKCPVCRSSYTKITNIPYYETIIADLELRCENNGCGWTGTIETYKTHRNLCEFKMIKCSNDQCNEMVVLPKLKEHLACCEYTKADCVLCQSKYIKKDEDMHISMLNCDKCENDYNKCIFISHQSVCEHQLISCWRCKQDIKKKDKTEHDNNQCPERYITCIHCMFYYQLKYQNDRHIMHIENDNCKYCDKIFPKCLMEKHLKNDCDLVLRKCEFDGCEETYTKITFKNHMAMCAGEHLLLLNKSNKTINENISNMLQEQSDTQLKTKDRIKDIESELESIKDLIKKLLDHFNVPYDG